MSDSLEAIINFFMSFTGSTPYYVVFGILIVCGLGVPIPEDIILIGAGMLCYHGNADLRVMIPVAMFGVLGGDSLIFYLGHRYGRKLTRVWPFRIFLTPERLELVQSKLHKRGSRVIFAARYMPGLRAPIYFSAGTLHLPFRVFLLYDFLASVISVPTWVWVTYHFGYEVDRVIHIAKKLEHGILYAVLAFVVIVFIHKYITRKQLEP